MFICNNNNIKIKNTTNTHTDEVTKSEFDNS